MTNPFSFYVGPTAPHLVARTWQDVVGAAAAGLLNEQAWLERKEAVPASSAGANTELARDLASLSVDGGTFVVGVTDATCEVVGTQGVDGLAVRVVQIAAGSIRPALFVETTRIPHPDVPGLGLLIVTVPASVNAPHMVDNAYWGRTDTGKRKLSDPDIAQLFERRRFRRDDVLASLRALTTTFDPFTNKSAERQLSHLYLMARPTAGHVGTTVTEGFKGTYALQILNNAVGSFRPQWEPSITGGGMESIPHPDGLMFRTRPFPGGEIVEEYAVNLLLKDDGTIQLATGGATRQWSDNPEVIVAGHILETAHALSMLTAHVATAALGYWGPWQIGVRIDKLKDLGTSDSLGMHNRFSKVQYANDVYEQVISTSTTEIAETPAEIVDRLLRPFLRGLALDARYLPYSNPSDIFTRRQAER